MARVELRSTSTQQEEGNLRFVLSAFLRYYTILKHLDAKNLLASQHYREQVDRAIDYAGEVEDTTLLIDSGAFSVWNKGGTLDLNDYINFLKDFEKNHRSKFKEVFYVNVDVIPGQSGRAPTLKEIEQAAKDGFQNYLRMKNEFDNIIHVFHQGDPDEALFDLLNTNPSYIGISPSNDVMTPQRKIWLDEVFRKVPKNIRTHGFAVTSFDLMSSFDWFSVDSTSWFMIGMYGKLCIPLNRDGYVVCGDDVIYDKVEVSLSPYKINGVDGYFTLEKSKPGFIKQANKYIDYLCKKYPIKVDHLFSHRNEARVLANLTMFLQFERQAKTCSFESASLF